MQPARATLLVVDDDAGIRDVVRAYAERDGLHVIEAADGVEAERMVAVAAPDVVVLDVMIPGIDGWELCRRWQAEDGPPVVMLTARGAEAERVLGLGLGADDYVVKPFSPLELMARIRAVLRRSAGRTPVPSRIERDASGDTSSGHGLAYLDVAVDLATRRAEAGGMSLEVTRRELDLLAAMVEAGDRVLSRVELLRVLGDGQVAATDRAVDQHMVSLRRKLQAAGAQATVETVRGVGYRLQAARR